MHLRILARPHLGILSSDKMIAHGQEDLANGGPQSVSLLDNIALVPLYTCYITSIFANFITSVSILLSLSSWAFHLLSFVLGLLFS